MKTKKSKTPQKKSTSTALLKYFEVKADKYDLVDEQSYWKLSDDLLWFLLQKELDKLPQTFTFLDAGAGTGRWATKILKKYPKSKGILIDISPDMLIVAVNKLKKMGISDRIRIIQADLMDSKIYKKIEVDVAYNFHNVIGFVESPSAFLKNLAKVVKTNGLVITLAPNLYHAIFFNILVGQVTSAKRILSSFKGKFTPEMPEIHFFHPDLLTKLYTKAGLKITALTGFPNVIYPGFQETQIEGETTSLKNLLGNKKTFNALFEIEKELVSFQDVAARGNNIYIVGRKVLHA